MAPHVGQEFVGWKPAAGGDSALGVVGFSIFPHLDNPNCPENTMADAEKWAAHVPVPGYGIDDETAVKVVDGAVEVASEGHWKLFDRQPSANSLQQVTILTYHRARFLRFPRFPRSA